MAVECAYGHQLSDEVRSAILDATEEFVRWEVCERTAEPIADARQQIERFEKTASEFQNTLLSGRSDAAFFAKHLIKQHFDDTRLSDKPDRLYSLSVVLTSFRSACQSAIRELEPVSTKGILGDFGALPSFKEGEAWDRWIRQLTKIIEVAGLPWRVRKDAGSKSRSDQQSPFTRLVGELQICLRESVRDCKLPYSESALPTAITQARRRSLRLGSALRSTKSGS